MYPWKLSFQKNIGARHHMAKVISRQIKSSTKQMVISKEICVNEAEYLDLDKSWNSISSSAVRKYLRKLSSHINPYQVRTVYVKSSIQR